MGVNNMYNLLQKRIETETELRKAQSRFYIENGYCESWSDEHKKPGDDGIRRYCTDTRWNQYNAGSITREQIVKYTVARREKELDKQQILKLHQLILAQDAPDITAVTIDVTWRRNSTWGWNPTATATIHTEKGVERYTGSASGCGYDKLTAAIGSALNQSDSIKRMLYNAKEKALAENFVKYTETESNRNFIAYGAGYGVLPYFEGGVGMSSFESVFNACGYRLAHQHETKTTNYYYFIMLSKSRG